MASTISNISSPSSSPSSTSSTTTSATTPRKHLTPLSTPTNNSNSSLSITPPIIIKNNDHTNHVLSPQSNQVMENKINATTNLPNTNGGHKTHKTNSSKQIVITQQVLSHPIQKSHRLNRQSEYLHSIGDYGKAAQLNRKGMSILERSKNLTCDNNALDSINHLISHYKSEYRFQRNLEEATHTTNSMNSSTIINNRSKIVSGPIVMEQYGDREMIMPKQYDLSESVIALSSTQSTNNHNLLAVNDSHFTSQCLSPIGQHTGSDTPSQSTPTTPGVTLYSELYNMFVYPWIQYQRSLEEATENEQLRKLFNKTLISTQQKLNQVMQKTQSAEESDMASSQFGSMSGMSSPLHSTNTDISKKLLSLSYSLNADKVTRLAQAVNKKDKEMEALKKKIKEQQEIISQHEENWKLMKQEAMESASNRTNQ